MGGLRGAIWGVALLLVVSGQGAFALPPGVAAEVVDLQGSGERKPALNASWVPARAQDDLSTGAFVRTGPASKMALVFADETQVRLNQNSLLQVKSVAGSAGETTTLRLELGRAWSQLAAIAAKHEDMQVRANQGNTRRERHAAAMQEVRAVGVDEVREAR